jgi:phage tail-like protein
MADDTGDRHDMAAPLPKFHVSVQLGDDKDVRFSEVTGLEADTNVVEHRQGDRTVFNPIKIPGVGPVGNVTLRKGILDKDAKFWTWFSEIKMNVISRRTVVINLLDETGAPTTVWTLHNAWPTKITGTDAKSEGNEVAVETVEIAYEKLEVKAA